MISSCIKIPHDDSARTITNGSGSTYTGGSGYWVNNQFAVPEADIANGKSGTVFSGSGVFTFPKNTTAADVFSEGDDVGFASSKAQAGTFGGRIGRAYADAAQAATTVNVKLDPGPRFYKLKRALTSTEITNKLATIDTGFGTTVAGFVGAYIISASGVLRNATVVRNSDGTLTVSEANIATSELIQVLAYAV